MAWTWAFSFWLQNEERFASDHPHWAPCCSPCLRALTLVVLSPGMPFPQIPALFAPSPPFGFAQSLTTPLKLSPLPKSFLALLPALVSFSNPSPSLPYKLVVLFIVRLPQVMNAPEHRDFVYFVHSQPWCCGKELTSHCGILESFQPPTLLVFVSPYTSR